MPAAGGRRRAAVVDRYERVRQRLDASAAGHLQRRVQELDVMNHALLLSAMGLMLFIPALISLAAVVPLGSDHGLANDWARHLGLTTAARHDLQHLFSTTHTVSGAATGLSYVITVLFAYAWPAELGRGYEAIWGLDSRGWRDLWRPLLWLLVYFVVIGLVASSGAIAAGFAGALLTGGVGLPVTLAWAWWSQHLLLGGRVAWSALLPGAVATAVALFGFSVGMVIYLSPAITSNSDKYGPIGAVFALLSFLIGFSVVLLGGALAGHTFYVRRLADRQESASA